MITIIQQALRESRTRLSYRGALLVRRDGHVAISLHRGYALLFLVRSKSLARGAPGTRPNDLGRVWTRRACYVPPFPRPRRAGVIPQLSRHARHIAVIRKTSLCPGRSCGSCPGPGQTDCGGRTSRPLRPTRLGLGRGLRIVCPRQTARLSPSWKRGTPARFGSSSAALVMSGTAAGHRCMRAGGRLIRDG